MKPHLTPEQKAQFIRDGYTVARGLLPREAVIATRDALLRDCGLSLTDPATWKSRKETVDWAWGAGRFTHALRSRAVEEVVEEVVGPHFVRGLSFHPGKETVGLVAREEGYIPVLTYPHPERATMEKKFVEPQGWHVDGINGTDVQPRVLMMVIFAYLTDVSEHGGATTFKPGSHRQVYEHWMQNGMTPIYELMPQFAPSLPVAGQAGDVIFFHYLQVHSGSDNFDDHIRLGLNTAVHEDPAHPYEPPVGPPTPDWTPFDYTLRTDTLTESCPTLVPCNN